MLIEIGESAPVVLPSGVVVLHRLASLRTWLLGFRAAWCVGRRPVGWVQGYKF